MSQPVWKCIANLGDVNPLDYGGLFVVVDETGVYPPEMERLEPDSDDEDCMYTVHRVVLDRCTYINGILSDNPFHPECSAWFAAPESRRDKRPQDTCYLSNVAECMDCTVADLQANLISEEPVVRAHAYRMIADYHGWGNFDSYPLTLTYQKAEERVARLFPNYAC